jgi:prepilin-type processing-associated H-X9-DG protein
MPDTIGESSRTPLIDVHYYFKPSDFSAVGPSQIFLLLDEHEDSINDGYFLIGLPGERKLGFEDHPGSRHARGANFVFADGHAERHQWKDSRTIKPVTRNRLFATAQANSPDVAWIHDHAMIPK